MIEIVDINGKRRKAKLVRVVDHEVKDVIHGGVITEKYVEVVIVGNRGEWIEWYPLKRFKEMNPDMDI